MLKNMKAIMLLARGLFPLDRAKLWLLLISIAANSAAALLDGLSFGAILLALSAFAEHGKEQLMHLKIVGSIPLLRSMLLGSSREIFTYFILIAIFCQACKSGFSYLGYRAAIGLSNGFRAQLQKRVYSQILHFSFPCVNRFKIGELVEYANIPGSTINPLTTNFQHSMSCILTSCTFISILLFLSVPLTLSMLVFALILGYGQKMIFRKIIALSHRWTEHIAVFNKDLVQSLNGIRWIFTYNRQREMKEKICKTIDEIALENQRMTLLVQSITPLNEFAGILLVGICLLIGPFLLDDTLPTISLLLTFISVIYRLASRVQLAVSHISEITSHSGPLRKLYLFLQEGDKEYAAIHGNQFSGLRKEIIFQDVSLCYPSKNEHAVQGVSFSLQKGTTLALVGASGAGKSSVIDLLVGLYQPSSGKILLDGHDLSSYSTNSWREKLGVVSQDTYMFNESIAENIRFGQQSVSHEMMSAAARAAGAHEFIMRLSEGYSTIVGERGYRLSGGERQRIALARALLRNPEVLILDEATSNLDSCSEHLIQMALEEFQKKRTVIIIAHRLSTVVKADQILVMEGGSIIERGTHSELVQSGGRYAYYWQVQSLQQPSFAGNKLTSQFVGP